MADEADDLGIPMKPARTPGQGATVTPVGRNAATPLPRPIDAPRALGDAPRTPELPRRLTDPIPVPGGRRPETEVRKLIVGREISLTGEITSCDRLVIEGSVEANLQNCREVDIAESGLFKGSASIDDAEVRGRFEGNLTVRKRLLIRATGRVSGTVRYGQIEIECGGQITGDVQTEGEIVSDLSGARAAL